MKNLLLFIVLIFCTIILKAQAPLIDWDKTFGGGNYEELVVNINTLDGGYLLAGSSYSNISGDKSENSKGGSDYWIVKTDANGNKQWDKTFGGSSADFLFSAIQTSDGGYILGGYSESYISGDKTENSNGGYDYWIIKTDANGNKQWDKTFGGSSSDILMSLIQTSDGGYLFGGRSGSNISGDKTENSKGIIDYWVVKIDSSGNKLWDKTFGGSSSDHLSSLIQTPDGGYLLGGYSRSNISGDKTENSKGIYDYWIVKIDMVGDKQWDKTVGGSSSDILLSLIQTSDGGYLLGGYSNSNISGDKSENNRGSLDYWIVKTDVSGNKQWDKTFGGSSTDILRIQIQTSDGGYLLGGYSASNISGDKTENSNGYFDYWIVKTDDIGTKQWDSTYGGNSNDYLISITQSTDEGYLLGGISYSNISGDKSENSKGSGDFWIVKLIPVIAITLDILELSDIEAQCVATLTPPTANNGGLVASTITVFPITSQGTTVVTWTYDDGNGNTATQMQNVIIDDVTLPTLVDCPANIDLYTEDDGGANCEVTVNYTAPTFADNCDGTGTATYVSGPQSGDSLDASGSPYTVIYSYQDAAGNTVATNCEFTITVIDNTLPSITCPSDITISSDSGNCDAIVNYEILSADNCLGETIAQTAGLASGASFPFGTTTNTFVVTDNSGNTATCSFDVTVNDLTTLTSVSVTPDIQQYSDKVTFVATVTPYNCPDSGIIGGKVTFKVGTQVMGTANIIGGVATLADVKLLEPIPFGALPTGQMDPGIHTVEAVFDDVDFDYTVTDPTTSLTITQEDAIVECTGQTLQATSNSNSSIATVVLSANVQDISVTQFSTDPYAGDIRNARVKFVNRDNNTDISGWIPVNSLIDINDNRTGTLSYDWIINIGNNPSQSTTIGVIVDHGYYYHNSSNDNTVVTIYKPDGDFITGGGYIEPINSSGTYASSPGLKTNFGFNVKYNKKNNKLKGHMNVVFRRLENDGVHTYQIKGNAIQSLGVNIADENNKTGVFITKSNLKDITDPLFPVSLGGNLTLKVDLSDKGEPGFSDSIAFNLTNSSNVLLYSSNWTVIMTNEMPLTGGNIVVHSGYSTESRIAKVSQLEDYEVKYWPNPSSSIFNLKFKTNTKLSIEIYDIRGRLVSQERGITTNPYKFGGSFKSGLYFVYVTYGEKKQLLKLVKH